MFENLSLAVFLQQLHEQRILDTALDAMSRNMDGETTVFEIGRLAAVAGKIAFPIPVTVRWEVCLKSPSLETGLAIGCRQRLGIPEEVKCPDTSTMNVQWTMTASLRRGFERRSKKCCHFAVPSCPRSGVAIGQRKPSEGLVYTKFGFGVFIFKAARNKMNDK